MEYRIERLTRENIALLVPLYKEVFNHSVPVSYYLKKYDTRYVGVEFVGFIALTHDGTAASYYGVIPCFCTLAGKRMVAAQSADTMTHSRHRKKGLFYLLASHTYVLARKLNIGFIFGFPNQNSLPGLIKLNWQFRHDQLQLFSLPLSAIAYGRLIRRVPLLSVLYEKVLNLFLGNRYDGKRPFELSAGDGVLHDDAFFSYKRYNLTRVVNLNGVKVWMKADGKLKIGAIHGLHDGNALEFYQRLKKLAFWLGCNEIIFITSNGSALSTVLSREMISKDAFPIGFLPLQQGAISFDDVSFEYCDVDIF